MTVFRFKTLSEQRLEYLESLKRPLTNEESELLYKVMHSVSEHERRQRKQVA